MILPFSSQYSDARVRGWVSVRVRVRIRVRGRARAWVRVRVRVRISGCCTAVFEPILGR